MIEKSDARICPECGKVYYAKTETPVALSHLVVDMVCESGHQWQEYYYLGYAGYTYNNKTYTRYGESVDGGNKNDPNTI